MSQNVLTRYVTSAILYLAPQNVTRRCKMGQTSAGEKLVKLRGKRTQEEVSSAVGISTSALSMYECGSRVPRDEIKIRLAKYYNRTVQYIFYS